MCKAIEVVNWFINNDYKPTNSKNSNLKLNKLLYFAQLISLVKRQKPLFKEDLYAFKNGVVVEDIRKEFCNNYYSFIDRAKNEDTIFNDEELDILEFTKEIFMDVEPDELSTLTHEHKSWKDNYEKSRSIKNGDVWYDTKASKININDYFTKYKCDLDLMENIINAKQYSKKDNIEKVIEVNGIKFYYNPNEVNINDYIETLETFNSEDTAYTLYIDEKQGLVIF